MSEITPTADHLNDPYVLQLIEALSKLDDRIEELEAEVERLQGRVKAYLNAMHTPHQEMVKRIEELEAENASLSDHYYAAMVQLDEQIAENTKLREALRYCAGRMEHPRCPRCADRQEVAKQALAAALEDKS